MAGAVTGGLVAVVGSANLDVVVTVERLAGPGETVLGGEVTRVPGGKGLNQAVAAARTTSTAFVGCVGEDDAGRSLRSRLGEAGVDDSHVQVAPHPTGQAFIQVAADGENSIVVAAGANLHLSADQVLASLAALDPALVLAQLEVPLDVVVAAASWAHDRGARFVLNPSPVRPLPASLLRACDPLVLNATEAAQVASAAPGAPPAELALALTRTATSVVVTDGPRGAQVATRATGTVEHVSGQPAAAVDTTGAGDEFAGCLAAALAEGQDLTTAARAANLAAARVVGVPRADR